MSLTDWEQFACELGSVGAISMLESRLESITAERDAALAEVDRLRAILAMFDKRCESVPLEHPIPIDESKPF
jgi:hypothetical protein